MYIDGFVRMMREIARFESQSKIRNREERYRKKYILRANKWTQIKQQQTRYNNTKHK